MVEKVSTFLLYLSLFLVIYSSSFSLGILSFHDQKRLLEIIPLLLSAVAFLLFFLKNAITGFDNKVRIGFYILTVILLISSSFSELQQWAFLELGWYFLIGIQLLLLTFLYQKDKNQFLKVFIIGIILLCTVYSIRVFTDLIIGSIRNNWTVWPQQHSFKMVINGVVANPNGFLNFSHVRFFNHLQTWTLPLLVYAFLRYKKQLIPGFRYLLLFFISSWWMLVFAADARGTMIASFFSILFIIILFKKKSFQFLKVYLFTTFAGLTLYLLLFLLPSSTEAREILTRFGDSGRLEVWYFALQQISEQPFLGLGPMHFSYMGINSPWSTPHNLILQSAAEWGVPALLIASSLFLYGGYHFIIQSKSLKPSNESEINMRIGLIASMTAVAIHAMFSGILNTPLSQLMLTLVGAWIVGEYYLKSEKKLFIKRKRISLGVVALLFLLVCNIGFTTYKLGKDIPHINERKEKYLKEFNTNKLYPRFWNQGMIYESEES